MLRVCPAQDLLRGEAWTYNPRSALGAAASAQAKRNRALVPDGFRDSDEGAAQVRKTMGRLGFACVLRDTMYWLFGQFQEQTGSGSWPLLSADTFNNTLRCVRRARLVLRRICQRIRISVLPFHNKTHARAGSGKQQLSVTRESRSTVLERSG